MRKGKDRISVLDPTWLAVFCHRCGAWPAPIILSPMWWRKRSCESCAKEVGDGSPQP